MKKILLLLSVFIQSLQFANAQSLGRVGSSSDIVTTCSAGTVLMGGGSDIDAAFTWMINKSGGGDFVVIRATGTNAYNSYIYGLGTANSVETFLINSTTLANDSAIVQAVRKAEAIFFAGGDQNNYITFYKGTALGATLDYLANVKHTPIGGTSAGMAIQGYIYYDGITNVLSTDVLQNPYASGTGIHYNDFLRNPFLKKTICDTHFDTKGGTTPNGITGRQGRLMTFLSRMLIDSAMTDVKAIACDEKTAVCIDENGIGMVVGFGKAYFLRQWCAIPEVCANAQPLTWTNGTKVYVISAPGNYTDPPTLSKSISLVDWTSVQGGIYEYWTVNAGILTLGQPTGTPIICYPVEVKNEMNEQTIQAYPNPIDHELILKSDLPFEHTSLKILDMNGRVLYAKKIEEGYQFQLDVSNLSNGIYVLEVHQNNRVVRTKISKQ